MSIQPNSLSTPVLKPGASIFFNRDGTITGKAGYTYSYGAYTGGFTIGAVHPYDSVAYLAQFGLTWDAAGYVEMDGDYVGVWSTTNYLVDGIASMNQEPIETNPKFVSALAGTPTTPILSHNPSWTLINAASTSLPPSSTPTYLFNGFGSGAADNMAGVTAYLSGGFVLRITNATNTAADVTAAIALLGVSHQTVTAGIITYSYSYYAFLVTNVTYKEIPIGPTSATFTITVEYTFTPPNGWNTLIYQTHP